MFPKRSLNVIQMFPEREQSFKFDVHLMAIVVNVVGKLIPYEFSLNTP